MPKKKTTEKKQPIRLRITNALERRRAKKSGEIVQKEAPKIRFDLRSATLGEPALHLAALVEHEVNFGKNKAKLTQPTAPNWDALIQIDKAFTQHQTHIEEVFNIKRGLPKSQLDVIAKCVYKALA